MRRLVAGLDLGSTGIKLLVLDDRRREMFLRKLSTPWAVDEAGAVVMHGEALLHVVDQLLEEATTELATNGDAHVEVLSVTGMGESGFLVGADGRPLAPAYAWFDRSGQEQVDAFPGRLRAEFAGRTGLPWGVQVSAAKIAHLRSTGVALTGATWLSLPEFVVHSLGGPAVAERSLAARTGLVDLDTGLPWADLLEHLGLGPDVLPPQVDAGTPLGAPAPGRAPQLFEKAQLTVAGHDHLVSSLSGESQDAERYHVSMGTAEVLLRVVETPLTYEARRRLADHLINCVPHVIPGRWVVVAGVKTGLLMRRTLALLGVSDDEARKALDASVLTLASSDASGAVTVTGARNDDGVLALTIVTDEVSPAVVMQAVLEHGNDEIRRLIEAMDAELPSATSALLTGGWTSWASVRAARSRVLPRLEVSERPQDTAYGAALLALALRDRP